MDELYTELSDSEQQSLLRGRVKEIEHSQFALRTELDEMKEVYEVATGRTKSDAGKEIDILREKIQYGEARLRVLRTKITSVEPASVDESTDAG